MLASRAFYDLLISFDGEKIQMEHGICLMTGSGRKHDLIHCTQLFTAEETVVPTRVGELDSAIICGCLPTLPRALVHIRSVVSSFVSGHRRSGAGDSERSLSRRLWMLGNKRPLASIAHFEDYHEMTNQKGRQNCPSSSESKSMYSAV